MSNYTLNCSSCTKESRESKKIIVFESVKFVTCEISVHKANKCAKFIEIVSFFARNAKYESFLINSDIVSDTCIHTCNYFLSFFLVICTFTTLYFMIPRSSEKYRYLYLRINKIYYLFQLDLEWLLSIHESRM